MSQDGAALPPVASPGAMVWRKFRHDRLAQVGLALVVAMVALAVGAPLLANGRPLLLIRDGQVSLPFLRYLFAPDSTETVVEKIFNYLLLFLPLAAVLRLAAWRLPVRARRLVLAGAGGLLVVPFLTVAPRLDKTDWRREVAEQGGWAVFAPVPYGPFENIATPYQGPSRRHLLGADQIGRDVFARMAYGARVSLAVGFLATGIAMAIGIAVGMITGYHGGKADFIGMRIVEVVMCFPTFLLLLILMAIMMDYKFEQSILLVIGVIGLTGWTGLSRIVRGEVLQQRSMAYVRAGEALALPTWRIMAFHLLPNVLGPVFVYFTFGVAGAILAESGLSFLGFGVRAPTASWGELLRQAFADPFRYWHLTLWPGLAIFIAVIAFNFAGEGLRRAVDPKG